MLPSCCVNYCLQLTPQHSRALLCHDTVPELFYPLGNTQGLLLPPLALHPPPALGLLGPLSREACSHKEGWRMAGDMVKILSSVLANFDYPVVGTVFNRYLGSTLGVRHHPIPHFKF